jgi:formate-dependent nitrite reductase cytochrome c552 subunit
MVRPRHYVLLLLPFAAGCAERDRPRSLQPPPREAHFAVTIDEPSKLTSIETHETDATGRPLRASCVTCHSVRGPSPLPAQASALQLFHKGLTVAHGALSCASCHDPEHPQSLHLADGTSMGTISVMRLCSQCHGPQRRDYDHGAHGGMSGYWDLSRGPRTRNNCVDCHDPHAPKYVGASPVLPPRDRLLSTTQHTESTHE